MDRPFRKLLIRPRDAVTAECGLWLWALEDAHRMLFNAVKDATPEILDFAPERRSNTIGTLLYHIAATDVAWLFEDILHCEFTPDVAELFPYNYRNEQGDLWPVTGVPLEEHIARLEKARALVISHVKDMGPEEFERVSRKEGYEVNPRWILYHLAEHENYHRGQIVEIAKEVRARRQ